jgi:hypothetical protein
MQSTADSFAEMDLSVAPNDHWTFLTDHTRVLIHMARHPDDTVLSFAFSLHMRERHVAAIIADLRQAGYIHAIRNGRKNHYIIDMEKPLRQPLLHGLTAGELVAAFTGKP